MKSIKDKSVAIIGGLGALCIACCTLPILGLLGLGAIEAYFCENEFLRNMGIALVVGAIAYFLIRKIRSSCSTACSTICSCKPN